MSVIRNVFGRYFGKPVDHTAGNLTEPDPRLCALTRAVYRGEGSPRIAAELAKSFSQGDDLYLEEMARRAMRPFSDLDIIPAHHSTRGKR